MSRPFELEHFLPYRLSVLTNTVSRALAREYGRRFGIAVLEWRVIAVVGHFAPITANGVAERTAMDKVAVSRAVRTLLDKGLLTRRRDPADGRRTLLSLSSRGRRIHARIVPLAERLEADLLSPLDCTEQAQFEALLDKLSGCARGLPDRSPA